MYITKRKYVICLFVGIIFFASCIKYVPKENTVCCNIDTTVYKRHTIKIEEHCFTFLLPEDYYQPRHLPKFTQYRSVNQFPKIFTQVLRDGDFGKAVFYSKNNKKNYLYIEIDDESPYHVDSTYFEGTILQKARNKSFFVGSGIVFSECYRTNKYKYAIIVYLNGPKVFGENNIDTTTSELVWYAIYDDKEYYFTLYSEEYYSDFSYEAKKKIINSIRIE
jgi:hypothetical protein